MLINPLKLTLWKKVEKEGAGRGGGYSPSTNRVKMTLLTYQRLYSTVLFYRLFLLLPKHKIRLK